MKTFVPALLLGVLIGAGLMLAVPRDREDGPGAPPPDPRPLTPERAVPAAPDWKEPAPRNAEPTETFAEGTAVLRIGDGFVFGEERARPGAEAGEVDVLLLDLRDTASLQCSAGAAAALLPPAVASGTPSPEDAFALLENAPTDFEGETVELRRASHEDQSGVGLVRADDGLCYKVFAAEFHDDAHALRRFIRIRYARVPQVDGGGVVPVPGGVGSERVDAETAAKLRPHFQAPAEIRSSRGRKEMTGDFVRLGEIPDEFLVSNRGAYVLPRRLDTKVTVGIFSSLYLEQGVSRHAVVKGGFHSGIVVNGEMAGRVETEGSFVRVRGDLTGTLVADNSTVVIEGDLLGTIHVTGIPEILIHGSVRDPSTALRGDGIVKVYVGGYMTRAQVESFPKQDGIWSLSLAESDIPVGNHRSLSAFWSRISVGAEIWEKLRR
jgi:hypothetical protein